MHSTNKDVLKSKVLSGLFWRFLERGGTHGIQFIVSIVLARLLTPTDYGIIGLLTVYISVAGVLMLCGFGSALIQKKEITETDYSTAFYVTLFIAFFLYALLFFTAPIIANFYSER